MICSEPQRLTPIGGSSVAESEGGMGSTKRVGTRFKP